MRLIPTVLIILGATLLRCPADTALITCGGSSDPEEEDGPYSWTRTGATADASPVASPLSAWRIHTEAKALFYSSDLRPEDIEKAYTQGWRLSAKVRLDTATVPFPRRFATAMVFESASTHGRWIIHILVEEDTGELLADVNNKRIPLSGLKSGEYHDYELEYDPVSGTARFIADGTPFAEGIRPLAGTRSRIAWGNLSGGPPSSSEWASVKLEILGSP